MSQYIKRQELKFVDSQDIEIPIGAKFLSMSVYQNNPCIYILIDRDKFDSLIQTQKYEIIMVLTEQLFCLGKGRIYQGSVNIKNVTAHFFARLKDDIIPNTIIYDTVAPVNATTTVLLPEKKKRGRPRKNAD